MGEGQVDYAAMYAKQANELAQKAYDARQQAIQLGVDKVVSDINYQKDLAKEDELKEAKSAYADYAKQINPYGIEKEAQVGMGLAGSGFQESSKVNMNNTYQNRVSKAVDTTRRLFADYNNQINQAKMEGNIQQAQALYDQYQFQIENLWKGFDLQYQQNRDAINDKRYEQEWQYQQNRDAVNDSRYNQEWEYQKKRDEIADSRYLTEWERQLALDRLDEEWRQKQFDYQQSRDAVSDSQWQKQYELQKKNSAASRARSTGSNLETKLDLNNNNENNTGKILIDGQYYDNPILQAAKYTVQNATAVHNIKSMSDNDFRSYVSNAYKNDQITKDEVDKLLQIRGV